ncbi:hypothetical protein GCM10010254_56260 [Streptomyces chromofuscus]|nr:hypothetical protein GCM10010254_56260 [Streptomyces chromofuscus]
MFAGGLHGPESSTVLRPRDGDVLISDGPYARGEEHLGGICPVQTPDLQTALTGAARPRRRRHYRSIAPVHGRGGRPMTADVTAVSRAAYGRAVAVIVRSPGDVDTAGEAVRRRARVMLTLEAWLVPTMRSPRCSPSTRT